MTDPGHAPPRRRPRGIERSHLPRIEFRKSQRRDAVFYVAAWFAATLSWIVRLVPDGIVDWVARRIGDLTYLTSKQWRANVESNMAHLLDEPGSSARVRRTAHAIFQTNAVNVATLLRSPHQSQSELLDTIRLTKGSWEILDEAITVGKGVVVLTAHLGSFDTMGSALAARGVPMSALTARTTGRFAFEFVTFLRRSHGLKLIEASSSGVREAIEQLHQGEVLCLLSDRDFFLNGRAVDFFGEETTLPVGAVRLARDSGATIVPIFTVRRGRSHDLMIEPSFTVERTDDRERDIEIGLRRTTDAIEAAIAIAPEQWVMFQRVWPENRLPTPG